MNPPTRTYHYIARNKKQLICSLYAKTISCQVLEKNGLAKHYTFQYADIEKVHLALPDISWHTMDIYFRDKTHIHLKSVTFFIERDQRQLERPKANQPDQAIIKENQRAYRAFVIGLHERLSTDPLATRVRFTHGNPWKKVLIWLFLFALLLWIPVTWKMGLYWRSFAFSTAFLFLLLFSRKINFRKHHAHDDIPLKYLPPSFEGNR